MKLLVAISVFSVSVFQLLAGQFGFNDAPIQGLVFWLPENEGSGTTALDYSGQGNTGFLTNAPAWTNGVLGSALYFGGTNFVNAGTNILISGDITVSMWTQIASTNGMVLAAKYNSILGGDQGWYLYKDTTGKILFGGRDSSTNFRSSGYSTQTVSDGNWHFVCGQRSGSTWKTFIDGTLGSSTNVGTTGSINAAVQLLTVGTYRFSLTNAFDLYFTGSIDDPRIYNRALTSNEIAKLAVKRQTQ